MPERFMLQFKTEDGSWMEEAICLAERFERLEDGSYICGEFSSGLWIRCVDRRDDHFTHVDGAGEYHTYRLVPLPMVDPPG